MQWLGIIPALLLLSCPALAQEEKKPEPRQETPAPKDEAKKPAPPAVISIEKSNKPDPCIIKPVMSDKELRDCGAKTK